MNNMNEALDFLGRPIKVGDTIVYPVRAGSSMWLQKMKVSQVVATAEKPRLVVYDPTSAQQRGHSVKNLHTVVVVQEPPVKAEAA
jgi:hypothetical protein